VSATGILVSCAHAKGDKNAQCHPNQKAQQGQKKRPHDVSIVQRRNDITLLEQMPDRALWILGKPHCRGRGQRVLIDIDFPTIFHAVEKRITPSHFGRDSASLEFTILGSNRALFNYHQRSSGASLNFSLFRSGKCSKRLSYPNANAVPITIENTTSARQVLFGFLVLVAQAVSRLDKIPQRPARQLPIMVT
jgi:hypothetical protein